MKQHIATLLNKEMDRKDFLKYLAAAGVMAMGGGFVLHSLGILNQPNKSVAGGSPTLSRGYGSSVYGG